MSEVNSPLTASFASSNCSTFVVTASHMPPMMAAGAPVADTPYIGTLRVAASSLRS